MFYRNAKRAIRSLIVGFPLIGTMAAPSLAQDATYFSPPQIAWGKPSAKHADSADAAGTAQRVDPSTLNACGNGKVLTLGDSGAFVCTDTVAHAGYASAAGDANTIGGKTADQLASTNPSSGQCNAKSFRSWDDRWLPNGATYDYAPLGGCSYIVYRYICVSGAWAQAGQHVVDNCGG